MMIKLENSNFQLTEVRFQSNSAYCKITAFGYNWSFTFAGVTTEGELKSKLEKEFSRFKTPDQIAITIDNDKRVPVLLAKYVINAINHRADTDVVKALFIDYDKIINNINNLLIETSRVTNLDFDVLLRCTDLNKNDIQPLRLSNALAELRAINMLSKQGFENIEFLPARKDIKQVDLKASYKKKVYAIDVAQIKNESQPFRYGTVKAIIKKINEKYNNKIDQLSMSKQIFKTDGIILALIIDEYNGLYALSSESDLESKLRDAYYLSDLVNHCGLLVSLNHEAFVFGI